MVPANRRVSQSNFDMVKATLLEAQNRVGQLEPGAQVGATHSWPNRAFLLLMRDTLWANTVSVREARFERAT